MTGGAGGGRVVTGLAEAAGVPGRMDGDDLEGSRDIA
jgi:hypothetical protein